MDLSNATGASEVRRLRYASLLEGTTLLVLLAIAVPLKHVAGWDMGVKVMGPIHGLAFVSYTWFAINAVAEADGNWKDAARFIALAIVPLGGFYSAAKLAKLSSRLEVKEVQ
jgi:integral membrane protein